MADYRVTAGYVTVTTAVEGGHARVDIRRGAALPDDVPDAEVKALLAYGFIEPAGEAVAEPEVDPDASPKRPAKTAAKPELVAWVVEHRHEAPDDVQKLTKEALWERIEAGPLPAPPADDSPADDNDSTPLTTDQQ